MKQIATFKILNFKCVLRFTRFFGHNGLYGHPGLAKLCYFKLIMAKSNLKKSVMTLFQWRHCY